MGLDNEHLCRLQYCIHVWVVGWVGSENEHQCRLQYCIYVEIVGGSEKARKYADIIYEWSLCDLFCVKNLFTGSHPTPKL